MRGRKFVRMGAVLLMLLALILPVTPAGATASTPSDATSAVLSLNTGSDVSLTSERSQANEASGPSIVNSTIQQDTAATGEITNPIIAYSLGMRTFEASPATDVRSNGTSNTDNLGELAPTPDAHAGYLVIALDPAVLTGLTAGHYPLAEFTIARTLSVDGPVYTVTNNGPASVGVQVEWYVSQPGVAGYTAISTSANTNEPEQVATLVDRGLLAPSASWQFTRSVSDVSASEFVTPSLMTTAQQTRAETADGVFTAPSLVNTIGRSSTSVVVDQQISELQRTASSVAETTVGNTTTALEGNNLQLSGGYAPSAELAPSAPAPVASNSTSSPGGDTPSAEIVAI